MNSRFGVIPLGITLCLIVSSVCAQDGTLLVVNRHSKAGSVSFFDLETETEIARIPVGPGWPHEVAVSPNGRLALTAEYGENGPGRYVTVMDIPGAQILGRIDMGPMSKPHDSVFLPDNLLSSPGVVIIVLLNPITSPKGLDITASHCWHLKSCLFSVQPIFDNSFLTWSSVFSFTKL